MYFNKEKFQNDLSKKINHNFKFHANKLGISQTTLRRYIKLKSEINSFNLKTVLLLCDYCNLDFTDYLDDNQVAKTRIDYLDQQTRRLQNKINRMSLDIEKVQSMSLFEFIKNGKKKLRQIIE